MVCLADLALRQSGAYGRDWHDQDRSLRAGRPRPMRRLMHLRQPRRVASAMLFVWLFAAFASWANACLVQPADRAATARGHHAPAGAGALAPHVPAEAGAAQGSDPAQEVCAEVCAGGQSLVATPQSAKGEGAADATLWPATAVVAWPAFTAGRSVPRWRPLAAPPPPGPSVVIAFLRLTR